MVAALEHEFFLGEILGRKVYLKSEKTGRLDDLVIVETGRIPEVTHLVVSRSFGYPSLLLPWDKIALISNTEIVADVVNAGDYEKAPPAGSILLKDHILDKKILDMDDHEVEVVYDVKLVLQNGKLYASEVDFSRYRLLRRLGLKKLANFMVEHNETATVSWMYVQPLPEHIGSFSGSVKLKVLKDKLHDIHPVDLADILEELDSHQRMAIFSELEPEHASDTLEEIEPRVQRELISAMKLEAAAKLINEMSPAQAADILAILPTAEADAILKLIDKDSAPTVQQIIEGHDENILLFATQQYVKMPESAPVGDVLKDYREIVRNMDVDMYVYVTDAKDTLRGVVDLRELIAAEPGQIIGEIMTDNVISLNPDETLQDAVDMFGRYGFRAIPVTDNEERLLGVVSFDDIKGIKPRLD
ncbi:MAG: magnesium transporter [Betaproteobacteria bacterium]|nr:MAG: magnesium transporter [Betaproteobacteria bacterium]